MYDHQKIEKKWQMIWDKRLVDGKSNWVANTKDSKKENYYMLDMFAYPSGSGLHAGHVEQRAAIDIMARYYRAKDKNVLMPTGYDSFGLPTENYALKNNLHPDVATNENTDNFDEQTKKLGISYDWTRKLLTSDSEYYKFTQWWFNFLYERGLAYRKKQAVNWCPKDQTVLANEQVIDGKCERCDSKVIQKNLEQWFFKITDYADRLLADLDKLDWPESTKAGQRNWIGKSTGTQLDFLLLNPEYFNEQNLKVTKKYTLGTQKYTVVFNTGNSKKIKRLQDIVSTVNLPINIIGINQVHSELLEKSLDKKNVGKEEPKILEKAAIHKSKKIDARLLGLPVIGMDTGFKIHHKEISAQINSQTPKRNALGGKSEKDLSKKEIGELMQKYYIELVEKYSEKDSVPATFTDIYAIQSAVSGEIKIVKGSRQVLLTSKKQTELVSEFPLNSIVISEKLQKSPTNLSPKDESIYNLEFLENFINEISDRIPVYTTRVDTVYGASFLVVSPEHEIIEKIVSQSKDSSEIVDYVRAAGSKTELERTGTDQQKSGVDTEQVVINPVNGDEIPLWVADYVLVNYGTGAVMGVPAHDNRDLEFADKYNLGVKKVVEEDENGNKKLINSDSYNGLKPAVARKKITNSLSQIGLAEEKTNYKLRDWSISRQRYWGAPIPILYKDLSKEEERLNNIYQELPSKVISLHALASSPELNYQKDLKSLAYFEKNGIEILVPALNNADKPDFNDWCEQILAEIDDVNNSVIIARSLSSWSALKVAESNKLRKLILIAPVNPSAVKSINEDSIKNIVNNFTKNSLNFEKISKNVGEIVFFLGTNDDYIPIEETEKFFKAKFGDLARIRFIRMRDKGHFNVELSEFPELMEEIIKPVDLRIYPETKLPVELPTDAEIQPSGKAPLATSTNFQSRRTDGFTREVDTLDTFVCSAWYYFRFIDPNNKNEFADPELLKKWGPVDFYIGGAEHTVLHLLYSRFFTKVAYDAGIIDYDEPFLKLRHQGLILGPDNRKMSKRWGNVINPNEVVDKYGADTLRIYEMFMGPLDQMKAWDDGGVKGVYRFLSRVEQYNNFEDNANDTRLKLKLNKLIDKISADIENLKFNTAVSEFMKFINYIEDEEVSVSKEIWQIFLQLLHPFAPFLTSELWQSYGYEKAYGQIELQNWPKRIEVTENVEVRNTIAVMVQGKKRGLLQVLPGVSQAEVEELVFSDESIVKFIESKDKIAKIIYVPGKIINFVLRK